MEIGEAYMVCTVDWPEGFTYVNPPSAANATSHLAILQSLLRAVCAKYNVPEWLISSEAAASNYATTGRRFVLATRPRGDGQNTHTTRHP